MLGVSITQRHAVPLNSLKNHNLRHPVEEHVNLILAKLNAANRAEAVAIALKKQLLKA